MSKGRCQVHSKYAEILAAGCVTCDAYVAHIWRIAATPPSGPRCAYCGTPVVNWRKHKAWHGRMKA